MHLDSLRVFCDVARHRSFSLAAAANDVTQSAVSQIVLQLERHMQVKLVDRSIRPLQLTPLGQAFFEGCQSVLEQYASLESSIRRGEIDVSGAVRVAAIYSVGLVDMGQQVDRFVRQLPDAQVHIDYAHPDRVVEMVLDGTCDLGIVSYPKRTPQLAAVLWREEPMVVACAPNHWLAQQATVRPRDLQGEKFVHFHRNLAVRRRVDRLLRQHKASVESALEFDTVENIKRAVALEAGISILPEPTFRDEVKAKTLVALPIAGVDFTRPLGILHRRQTPLSAASRKFMETLLLHKVEQPGASHEVASLAGGNVPLTAAKDVHRNKSSRQNRRVNGQ